MSGLFCNFAPKLDLYKTDVARKKKELPLLEKVTITDVAAEGKAVAKVNDLVIFVPYVVPGDVVDLQVKRKKNHYAEAVAVKFYENRRCVSSRSASIMAFVAVVSGSVLRMKTRFAISRSRYTIT